MQVGEHHREECGVGKKWIRLMASKLHGKAPKPHRRGTGAAHTRWVGARIPSSRALCAGVTNVPLMCPAVSTRRSYPARPMPLLGHRHPDHKTRQVAQSSLARLVSGQDGAVQEVSRLEVQHSLGLGLG